MILNLPTSLEISGNRFDIYTDYRDVLLILESFEDPNLTFRDKVYIVITNLYKSELPKDIDIQKAYEQALWFLNAGKAGNENKSPNKLMSWSQDFMLLIPPINKAAGKEIRAEPYMHWWTFLGYYQEIGECVFSQYISIRYKLQKGISLSKQEKEMLRNNHDEIILKTPLSETEQAQEDDFFYGG